MAPPRDGKSLLKKPPTVALCSECRTILAGSVLVLCLRCQAIGCFLCPFYLTVARSCEPVPVCVSAPFSLRLIVLVSRSGRPAAGSIVLTLAREVAELSASVSLRCGGIDRSSPIRRLCVRSAPFDPLTVTPFFGPVCCAIYLLAQLESDPTQAVPFPASRLLVAPKPSWW